MKPLKAPKEAIMQSEPKLINIEGFWDESSIVGIKMKLNPNKIRPVIKKARKAE